MHLQVATHCLVTNHVPNTNECCTHDNKCSPLKIVCCQMLLYFATQKKSSNLFRFSTCQKKITQDHTLQGKQSFRIFLSSHFHNNLFCVKCIRYKHNLFCHKHKNHYNHDNSTPASNFIKTKQVSPPPWNSRKQQRICSGMALDGHLAHILQAISFFASIFSFWNFHQQLAIDISIINDPSSSLPTARSRKSKNIFIQRK